MLPLHLVLLLTEGIVGVTKRQWAPFREIYLACLKALWHERVRLRRLRRVSWNRNGALEDGDSSVSSAGFP